MFVVFCGHCGLSFNPKIDLSDVKHSPVPSHAGEQRMLPHPVSEINEAGMPFKMVDIDFFLEPMLEMEQA